MVSALNTITELANSCMLVAEAQLCNQLDKLLLAASNKQNRIRDAADAAVVAITSKMSPNAVQEVLPTLFTAAEVGVAWQTRALSLKVIASFGDYAPEQLGFSLPQVSAG